MQASTIAMPDRARLGQTRDSGAVRHQSPRHAKAKCGSVAWPVVTAPGTPLAPAHGLSFLPRDSDHFFERRHPASGLTNAILLQGKHSILTRHLPDLGCLYAPKRKIAQRAVHFHQLKDAASASVAAASAIGASDSLVPDDAADILFFKPNEGNVPRVFLERGFALLAAGPHKALSHNGLDGGCDEEGLDAHIDETGDG